MSIVQQECFGPRPNVSEGRIEGKSGVSVWITLTVNDDGIIQRNECAHYHNGRCNVAGEHGIPAGFQCSKQMGKAY